MTETIKQNLQQFYENKPYHPYSTSIHGLKVLFDLSPRSRNLYLKLLSMVDKKCSVESIIINSNYKDLEFNTRDGLSKALKPLKEQGLVISNYGSYFINPNVVNYLTVQQYSYFKKLLGFTNHIVPKMGDKIPKPPIPRPPKE